MKWVLLFLVVLWPLAARANNKVPLASLFFTPQEAHTAETLAAKSAPAGAGDINLGAVFYYGPQDWVVWIRGEKWTPDTVRDDLRIVEVTTNKVRLRWHNEENPTEQEISLHPNQSFQIATGRIIATP